MKWAEWFLAANAEDRALGEFANKRASALDRSCATGPSASPTSINFVCGLNRSQKCRKGIATRTSVHSRSAATVRTPRRSCFEARLLRAKPFDTKPFDSPLTAL